MKKLLLLGAGSIGKRHLMNAVAVGAREITIVDPREDRQIEARTKTEETLRSLDHGLQTPLKLTYARTSREAYKEYGPFEAVIIAMPPMAHLEEIERAVENGAAIFCEKPLAKEDLDVEKTLQLSDKIKNLNLVNMVAYNYRFNPQLIQLKQLLHEGIVGKILTIRGTFSECVRDWHPWEGLNFYMSSKHLGGGALLDESHLVDICRWQFGEITEVISYNETVSSLKDEEIFDTDDLVEMMVRFKNGTIGSIHMDLYGRYHQKRIEVIGEEGAVIWSFDNSDLESNRIEIWKGKRERITDVQSRRIPEAVYKAPIIERNFMYLEEMKYFFKCIEQKKMIRADVPDIADGLKTMAVLIAARKSTQSRKFEETKVFETEQVS